MARTRADLEKIIGDAEAIEAKYKGKPIPEDEGKKLADLYAEGEALSKEINEEAERHAKMRRMRDAERYLRETPDPALPGGSTEKDTKAEAKAKADPVVAYTTPGHLVVLSEAYNKTAQRGWSGRSGVSVDIAKALLPVRGRLTPQGLVALTEAEVKTVRAAREAIETKDLPVIGEYVIEPNRVDRFVQDTLPDVLTLRNILNVSPTSSPTVQYVAEVSYAEAGAVQSEGTTKATVGSKAEADVEYELREASVKTIAVTMPVTEQQLSDAPALINRINTRLLWDLRKKEEQLCGYGDGTALQFAGFFDAGTGIGDADDRAGVGDTLLDTIRRGFTDVMTDGYLPNAIWMHPIDWEAVELLKGSDGHYIWAIIRDQLGPRVWGMRVVQGVGTQLAGDTTRNLLIGDFANGAVLYDREQSNVAVGWIDDQFAKNMRTIRAEMRSVLVVDRPKAFRKYETNA